MTKVNPQSSAQDIPDLEDDDMPSEYTFSGNGVRGKYYKAIQEHGYSVTVHHEDGTSTTQHISPSEVMEQNRQRELLKAFNHSTAQAQNHTWTGDSNGVRGKHAHRVGKPYTVTIHNDDGTATVQQFDGKGNMTSERKNVWIGDRDIEDEVVDNSNAEP